ncbi:hypothetical protein BD410DRAFT_794328 [Rickenella mellea]|uniref:ABC1 atypical kinase-like domain-containing protein n=1 Tax=Rickenella mellea TaxID=50990 RepID=A0A4Y7PQ49_9AGAM|nr:hypothetical protein BD410DRAFT_794328 [Rickenella mellea]
MDPGSNLPSYYTTNSELVLELEGGCCLTVRVLKVFTPFSRSQVSLVARVTEDHHHLPPVFILKTFDPRFDAIRIALGSELVRPWSQKAEADAEALRRQGTPSWPYRDYEIPLRDDLVSWEQMCYKRMDCDCTIEMEAYRRLQAFQGHHIPIFYGEAKLLTTDVTRAIIPRVLLIEYIPNALPINKINKDLITQTLAKSFLELLKAFHARGVVHNDLNHGNILVVNSSENDHSQTRAVFIDFGEACLRESETDEEWELVIRQHADTIFMLRQLKKSLGTEDLASFIREPIDQHA